MLEKLHFKNVGPAPYLNIDFRERLNYLTGDNGLGKSFILDVAWWALTRTWARLPVVPHDHPAKAMITYQYQSNSGASFSFASTFNRETEEWSSGQSTTKSKKRTNVKSILADPERRRNLMVSTIRATQAREGIDTTKEQAEQAYDAVSEEKREGKRPAASGLVLYGQVNGGFSVWDPARNYWKKDNPKRPQSYLFTAQEVWDGNDLCEGLIRDWAAWQQEDGEAFAQLKRVLRALSPSADKELKPGQLRKVSLDDPKRYPTLQMPYDQEVALIHVSAGMRRIAALAYLLVWTWQEHQDAAKLRGDKPTKEIILLIDEVEAHLHPQWQHRVVSALLNIMKDLTDDHDTKTQLIMTSHSLQVFDSVKPLFDKERDDLFLLRLEEQSPVMLHLGHDGSLSDSLLTKHTM